MILKTFLVVLSVVLTIGCFVPYFIDIIKGNTKPRIVSWMIWSTLTAIACAAAFVEHEYPTGILLLFSSLGTLAIAIFGWGKGDKNIGRLDVMCLIGAIVGLILWAIFNSPAVAVIAAVVIDFTGGLPSLVHSWKKPLEETWITYALSCLGAICTILVIVDWRITAFAYPLYIVIINITFTLVILLRRRSFSKRRPNKKR